MCLVKENRNANVVNWTEKLVVLVFGCAGGGPARAERDLLRGRGAETGGGGEGSEKVVLGRAEGRGGGGERRLSRLDYI